MASVTASVQRGESLLHSIRQGLVDTHTPAAMHGGRTPPRPRLEGHSFLTSHSLISARRLPELPRRISVSRNTFGEGGVAGRRQPESSQRGGFHSLPAAGVALTRRRADHQ
ncbi:hypothetical protein E2C01_084756 [Portunus trituberculatus]|uniref:Uncharacterized protein n=1 Tax=Portunus trituberculatus TaxID=210409 RepID=A0A5B7J731_PORTR|nr:hypothetical protein [Portunus trituberculatus]